MTYAFPAIIARPVAHDCDDTIPIHVETAVTVSRDGALFFEHNARVMSDAAGDGGAVLFERGEVIRWQKFTQRNLDQLERAYRNNVTWDAADERQAMPNYDVPVDAVEHDFDQRGHQRSRAA